MAAAELDVSMDLPPLDAENAHPNQEDVAPAKPKKAASKAQKKTIEQTYQKKTQLEHILLRPDTYIGSTEAVTQHLYVLDGDSGRFKARDVTFTPGLYKIFDEILVNAADNKQRDPAGMDRLEVSIDADKCEISVLNNGKGIPVVMHKEHKCYVPTLIFGHLLTGSNFDDDEKKTTGGRNGYGAKLANIFSAKFVVECLDAERGLKFRQVFRDNMHVKEKPTVKEISKAEAKKGDYTRITFRPDLARFRMERLDDDTLGLLSKRAYDIAGSMAGRGGKKLQVFLNDTKVPVKDFKSYLGLFDGITPPAAFEKIDDRWEVGVGVSAEQSFQQISFVNSIATTKGGGHVNYMADQVAKKLQAVVKKKNKGGGEIKPAQIKNHLAIFVNCLVENPTFDSQTKENMTVRPSTFSKVKLSDKFLKAVEKSGVVDSVLSYAKYRQNQALKRKGGTKKTKLTGITKLDDANDAGTVRSRDCTLILTEGDSAKSLAVSGLSVVGRDCYGVFPLKGKLLNVRDATHAQIMKNEEIMNLVEILGLKFNVTYTPETVKSLRYGHLMIMADQDFDGSHIKGLVINFLHHFWPSLLDVPGFLQQFITPIVKCTKGPRSETFFTLPEYEEWKEATGNDAKGWHIKYYKGLGTSTSGEAKEYFSNLDVHEIHFNDLSSDVVRADEEDEDGAAPPVVSTGAGLIDMAFSKSKVDDRKRWLNAVEKDTFLNYRRAQARGVDYSEFINRELVLFSQYDNVRSIPHVLDGFKPSQRKVLYACFKKNLRREIKVAQLAGYIGEHSAYHHGDMSLNGTIIGMAQSYCGSNNVHLLTPGGQFGTRRMGGKDHASARYVFTKLEKITRAIFHPDDDDLLHYLNDDGLSIEPEHYMPVIPMVLVNGSDGIGTGWSSTVQKYDPREIVANLRRMIRGEEPEAMHPHFSGYTGEITAETGKREGSYIVKGKIERTDDTTLVITELPIGKWTQDYKAFLEGMMTGTEKTPSEITDFKENHTDTTVHFTVIATKAKIDEFEKAKGGLHGKFKLSTTISTNNMMLFDNLGKIHKYKTAVDILKVFYDHRLEFYGKRKALLLQKMAKVLRILSNKARFVEEVCTGDLVVSNRKRKDLLADLKERGYDLIPKEDKKAKSDSAESDDDAADEDAVDESASDAELARGYEYLLGMKIWSLTFERAEELRRQKADKEEDLARLQATPSEAIWLTDLDAIDEALDERDVEIAKDLKKEVQAQSKNKARNAKKKVSAAKKAKKATRKADTWDSDLEDSDEGDDDFVASKPAPKARSKPKAAPKKKAVKAPAPSTSLASAIDDLKKLSMNDDAPTAADTATVAAPALASSKPAKKAPAKPAKKPTKKAYAQFDSDDDSDASMGGSDDEASSLVKAPARAPAKLAKKAPARPAKKSSSLDEESDAFLVDSESEAEANPAPKKAPGKAAKKAPAKAAKKPAKKAYAQFDSDDDSDASMGGADSDAEPSSVKKAPIKKAPAKKAPAKKAPAKKPPIKTYDSTDDENDDFMGDSDDDSDDDSDSDVEAAPAPVAPRERRGRAAAQKKVTYIIEDSDDESFDEDSDGSDF